MKRILVTGATGNVGSEVIRYLLDSKSGFEIIAAVRNLQSARDKIRDHLNLSLRTFDFEDTKTFNPAFTRLIHYSCLDPRTYPKLISDITNVRISYESINPVSFYFKKRKEGVKSDLAMVITLLHFLPRFQVEPVVSDNFQKFTGRKPTRLAEFIEREKEKLVLSPL